MDVISSREAISYAVSAGIGWLAALVTFRTRMAQLEWRATALEAQQKNFARAVERVETAFRSIDRRQMVQLQLSADIARKMGLAARVPEDLLVKLLSDDDTAERDRHE